jgi:hypothetical protein
MVPTLRLRACSSQGLTLLPGDSSAKVSVASTSSAELDSIVGSCSLQDGNAKSVDDVLREANALLENLSAGLPSTTPALQASIDELEQMGYVCDESGCVLVLPGDRERAAGVLSSAQTALVSLQGKVLVIRQQSHLTGLARC